MGPTWSSKSGPDSRRGLSSWPSVADEEGYSLRPIRQSGQDGDRTQLVWGRAGNIAIDAEDLLGPRQRIDQQAAQYRADLMEPILEGGCDAEIAAAAAQSPEEVGILVRIGPQQAALSCNQVNRQQVVAGEAVLAIEKAMAATERQAGDASRTGHPAGGCQTKGLRLVIEVTPGDPTLGADGLACRI